MADKASGGKRQQALTYLRRQITMASRMAKNASVGGVSWNLACKWLENHLDVLVEFCREIKSLPAEDQQPSNGDSTPVIPAGESSSVDISRQVADGTSNSPQSGRVSRGRQHTPA